MEQAVTNQSNARMKRIKLILRIIQVVVLVLLIIGEVLGITISGALYEASQAAFWQWVFLMVVLALPALLLVGILEIIIRRRSTKYDYELKGSTVIIYRLVYDKRKPYLSFDLNSVKAIRPYTSVAGNPAHAQELRKSFVACCNYQDDKLLCISTSSCSHKQRNHPAMVIMEPNEEFRWAFQKECGRVMEK